MFDLKRQNAKALCELFSVLIEVRASNAKSREARNALWALACDARKMLPDIICPNQKGKRRR
jgi:hypothetical protein